MRKLDMTRDALKFLGGLDSKRFKQVAYKMLSLLAEPEPNDSQQLKGSDKRRCDIGEFRIIYSFTETTVAIALISKRNDDLVYREKANKTFSIWSM